jgi:cellulose biosynthesis protein BcsQ
MIVTFYSYKGGTGRTMALANIACLLAKAGRRVLAVDFDLEAPGVWRYFEEFQRGLDRHPGLMDLLLAQANRVPDGAEPDWRRYTTRVRIGAESVTLLTSGEQDDGYPGRVLGFDWSEFFRTGDGGRFFERLRDEWNREYDFVLVDSRTGITDIGGICTIALPDMIVPVFVANHQNLEGVVDTLRRAQRGRQKLAYDRPPAMVLPVLSRFDSRTELESANEWLTRAASMLGEFYADWLPRDVEPRAALERTKLPHVAYFGFGERLAVQLQGVTDPDSLGYALNSVARLIDSHLKDVRAVVLGTDEPRSPMGTAVRQEPTSDSWIAALYGERNQLIGTGVVIDRNRVLVPVTAVVLAAKGDLRISFPKSEDRLTRRKSYTPQVSPHPPGTWTGVVWLPEGIPDSVAAAPLRFPAVRDLIGRQWWSFGFPGGYPLGAAATGTVGGQLAHGMIRLDAASSSYWERGVAGAPVWSPDHDAVVAVVASVNGRNSAAIPVAEIADELPGEALRHLAVDGLEAVLDVRQRNRFVAELGTVFADPEEARLLLDELGMPRSRMRSLASFKSPHLYWDQVLTDVENGQVPNGLDSLAGVAAALYPGNRVFQETSAYLRATAPREE